MVFGYSYSNFCAVTSLGMSTARTGSAGSGDIKAFFTAVARSLTSLTRMLCLTQGRVMPTASTS